MDLFDIIKKNTLILRRQQIYLCNKNKIQKKQKEYRMERKEILNKKSREYYKKNIDKINLNNLVKVRCIVCERDYYRTYIKNHYDRKHKNLFDSHYFIYLSKKNEVTETPNNSVLSLDTPYVQQ